VLRRSPLAAQVRRVRSAKGLGVEAIGKRLGAYAQAIRRECHVELSLPPAAPRGLYRLAEAGDHTAILRHLARQDGDGYAEFFSDLANLPPSGP
jgi:hypothetical protein